MKKIFAFVFVLLIFSSFVFAINIKSGAKGAFVTDNGDDPVFSGTAAGTDNATGGIITNLSLSTTSATTKWQGYVGSMSAILKIGSGSSILYNFGSVPISQILGVYASTGSDFDFSVVEEASRTDADNAWGFVSSDADSITSTMWKTGGTQPTSNGDYVWFSRLDLNAFSLEGTLSSDLSITRLIEDSPGATNMSDFAFTTFVNSTRIRDYSNSSVVDFQLLVPVTNPEVTQTYYFFMDIR